MNKEELFLKNIFLVLCVFLVILVLFLAHLMSSFLVPIFIAFFTAFLLQPFIKRLIKANLPAWLASLIVISLSVLIISVFLFIIVFYTQKFLNNFPLTLKEFQKSALNVIDELGKMEIVKSNMDPEKLKEIIFEFVAKINFGTYMISTMTKTLAFLKDFMFYLIALIFILPGMNRITGRIIKAFPDKSFKINKIIFNIMDQIQKYIFVKSIISLCLGIIVTLLCFIFQIKYAFLFGFITFLFHFVPYLGAFTSISITVIFSFFQTDSLIISCILLVILSVIYAIFSEILEPKFQGEGINLSPIIIFTSLFIWGYIWGVAGVFLSVPIMSGFNVICENIEVLKPISRLISNKKRIQKKKSQDLRIID
jgi:AI-2 transport protein TqsA